MVVNFFFFFLPPRFNFVFDLKHAECFFHCQNTHWKWAALSLVFLLIFQTNWQRVKVQEEQSCLLQEQGIYIWCCIARESETKLPVCEECAIQINLSSLACLMNTNNVKNKYKERCRQKNNSYDISEICRYKVWPVKFANKLLYSHNRKSEYKAGMA